MPVFPPSENSLLRILRVRDVPTMMAAGRKKKYDLKIVKGDCDCEDDGDDGDGLTL